MPTKIPNELGNVLAMMKSIKSNIPMPVSFASEDGNPPILLDELIQHVETMAQVDNSVVIAGVAQSGERLPRKQEAAGSIPVSSSKAFSEDQRQKMAMVVHHRVGLEDNLRLAKGANKAIKEAEDNLKKVKEQHESKRTLHVKQAKFHKEQMEIAEGDLRESILQDVMLKGTSTPEAVEEVHVEEEPMDIGRAE